jgi:GAF domain-containing protein
MPDPTSSTEHTRINALESLGVLDTPAEQRFDRFTRLAAMTFGVPIALVSLVDQNRQWFKSRCGLDVAETPRSIAFCSHAVALGEMLVIEDSAGDARFAHNPLVTGAPHIRFYAASRYSATARRSAPCASSTAYRAASARNSGNA